MPLQQPGKGLSLVLQPYNPVKMNISKNLLNLSLVISVQVNAATINEENQKVKPNVIFILADDMGIGDLGCYGQKLFKTPNIDYLASEGIRFTNHYTGAPVCAPSRCTLLTGLHTGHCAIRQNHSQVGGGRISLSDKDYTIGLLAREAGYKTAAFGKWGVGEEGTEGVPNKKGFDEFFGYLNNDHCEFYYTDYLYENHQKVVLEENLKGKQGIYTQDLFTDKAKNFITKNQHNPFFIYLAYTIPHALFQVPDEDRKPFNGKFVDDGMLSFDSTRAVRTGMIIRMDRQVGEIMFLLKSLGIDDNTLVFFSSDNGAVVKQFIGADYFDSNSIYRGYKSELYDGGIHTPLIARWPGKIRPGTTSSHISAFWDFLPTLAEIMESKIQENTDGISYLPTLLGKPDQKQHDYLYWEFVNKGKATQAIRFGNFKVIRNGINSTAEVYNLIKDPGETTDLSPSMPEIAKKGILMFDEAHIDHPHYPIR